MQLQRRKAGFCNAARKARGGDALAKKCISRCRRGEGRLGGVGGLRRRVFEGWKGGHCLLLAAATSATAEKSNCYNLTSSKKVGIVTSAGDEDFYTNLRILMNVRYLM